MFQSKEITNEFEKFDIEWLEKNGTPLSFGKIFSYQFHSKPDTSTFFLRGNSESGYLLLHYLNNKYFKIVKVYYPNGNIKRKGWALNNSDTRIGIWYEFDEKGNLLKTTDYDKLTEFSVEDVIRYCQKENIALQIGYIRPMSGYYTSIYRDQDEKTSQYRWMITWQERFDKEEFIWLDGQTGKVVDRKQEDFFGE